MKDKKDYSGFYLSMVIILSIVLVGVCLGNMMEDVKYIEHLDDDLKFAKETAEFILYEAEIIDYCANMSNLSNNELLTNFLEYKADGIIDEFAKEVEDE